MDASELDEAVADYMVQLASEGGTEEEVWSVMEGCYPELEEVGERIPMLKCDLLSLAMRVLPSVCVVLDTQVVVLKVIRTNVPTASGSLYLHLCTHS